MSLSTNEDTCIFLKVKLVRDSGPRGCCSIMDPMNNCSKMLVRDSGPKECYYILNSSDVKINESHFKKHMMANIRLTYENK